MLPPFGYFFVQFFPRSWCIDFTMNLDIFDGCPLKALEEIDWWQKECNFVFQPELSLFVTVVNEDLRYYIKSIREMSSMGQFQHGRKLRSKLVQSFLPHLSVFSSLWHQQLVPGCGRCDLPFVPLLFSGFPLLALVSIMRQMSDKYAAHVQSFCANSGLTRDRSSFLSVS